jgi:hypothetical protein
VHGSSNLIQTLLRHGLVDRFRLLVYPVVIGSGKRLFGEGAIPATLRAVNAMISPSASSWARMSRPASSGRAPSADDPAATALHPYATVPTTVPWCLAKR